MSQERVSRVDKTICGTGNRNSRSSQVQIGGSPRPGAGCLVQEDSEGSLWAGPSCVASAERHPLPEYQTPPPRTQPVALPRSQVGGPRRREEWASDEALGWDLREPLSSPAPGLVHREVCLAVVPCGCRRSGHQKHALPGAHRFGHPLSAAEVEERLWAARSWTRWLACHSSVPALSFAVRCLGKCVVFWLFACPYVHVEVIQVSSGPPLSVFRFSFIF